MNKCNHHLEQRMQAHEKRVRGKTCSFFSCSLGLTLLELLLALSVLSVVLLAGGGLSLSVSKMLHRTNAQTRAFDTVNYIIRFMEKDIKQITPGTASVNNQLCFGYYRYSSLNFQSAIPESKWAYSMWSGDRYEYAMQDRAIQSRVTDWMYISSAYSNLEIIPYAQADDFSSPVTPEDLRGCSENPCYGAPASGGTSICPNIWDIVTDSDGNQTLILRIAARVSDSKGKTIAKAGIRKYFTLPRINT